MREIIIDTYRCSGCGTCVELCPEVFRLDDMTGKAELVTVDPQVTDAAYEAAAYCPEKCIEFSPPRS